MRDTVPAGRVGRAELPGSCIRSLIDRMHTAQQGALAPRGPSSAPSAFSSREIDVPRLLAGGWDMVEVASRLYYSGRTIKSVITSMMNRLGLHKRSHAVVYALRRKLL
ncbi:LuxR C-terminal-related transcriptional regulator [Streptomyces sp. NBC_00841]|uniref:response regulator transcription factor n=1 Tax=Streptomyces sp. NBC_00841 TaxID=2975847 RepID=UPI002DDAAB16|nr:LuxR C-terminal-related transcriptional regulator [Streptomyces sp. NBC_00841]WRZ97832.1 LuxR C-terminal-related transcriptional regulator [Streptomyces sp. NBC_00841]